MIYNDSIRHKFASVALGWRISQNPPRLNRSEEDSTPFVFIAAQLQLRCEIE